MRDINPQAAAAEERVLHGTFRSVTPGAAKLVLRSSGAGHAVVYSVGTASEACQGFEQAGNVAYSGRGVVFPWIARMNERTRSALFKTQPYIEREVDPGRIVQSRQSAIGNRPTHQRPCPWVRATVARLSRDFFQSPATSMSLTLLGETASVALSSKRI